MDELALDLSTKQFPPLSISPTAVDASVKQPLTVEKTRLVQISKHLQSLKDDLKSILGCAGSSADGLAETATWLEGVEETRTEAKEKDIIEARQANNQLQAELATRGLGLDSSLKSAQDDLEKLHREGASSDDIKAARDKVQVAQRLVDK